MIEYKLSFCIDYIKKYEEDDINKMFKLLKNRLKDDDKYKNIKKYPKDDKTYINIYLNSPIETLDDFNQYVNTIHNILQNNQLKIFYGEGEYNKKKHLYPPNKYSNSVEIKQKEDKLQFIDDDD